jgi:hypothetical protein
VVVPDLEEFERQVDGLPPRPWSTVMEDAGPG